MGREGFEPSHPYGHKILNLARLPVPPPALRDIITQNDNNVKKKIDAD